MLDLAIRGGTVVDGTGAPGSTADVGVSGGRIFEIGPRAGRATREIDASGLIVCPGFVDPHTHYDAQLFWDPLADPSNIHGVTTVIGGNCGFTLAPLAPGDGDYLRRMMAKVEGMPLAALESGLDWDWDSFGEYLDRVDRGLGVNAGFLVGHCAIRRRVMGERAVGNEATADEIASMRRLLAESIQAGGLGFSTSLSYTHNDGDGQPVASRWAGDGEVLELCEEVADHEGTTLEFVTDGCMKGFTDDEVELMTAMSLAGRRPLNWNVLTIDSAAPERYREQVAACQRAADAGGRVVALTMPVLVGMNMSFLTHCALAMLPGVWGEVLTLPVDQRMQRLRDPEVRARMADDAASPEAGVFSRLVGWGRYRIGDTFSAENESVRGRLVADIAAERGIGELDALVDVVLADDLRTVLWPGPTDDDDESWRLRAEAWENPNVMIGGSDAGAHLDRMSGAPYTTAFLGDCIRGRRLATMERAVQFMTDAPARLFGLRGRGRVEVGGHADLVVFDPTEVDAGEVTLVPDLPGGAGRLVSPSRGVHRVLVGGEVTVADGEATGARPGRVLRSATDTVTVPIPASS